MLLFSARFHKNLQTHEKCIFSSTSSCFLCYILQAVNTNSSCIKPQRCIHRAIDIFQELLYMILQAWNKAACLVQVGTCFTEKKKQFPKQKETCYTPASQIPKDKAMTLCYHYPIFTNIIILVQAPISRCYRLWS